MTSNEAQDGSGDQQTESKTLANSMRQEGAPDHNNTKRAGSLQNSTSSSIMSSAKFSNTGTASNGVMMSNLVRRPPVCLEFKDIFYQVPDHRKTFVERHFISPLRDYHNSLIREGKQKALEDGEILKVNKKAQSVVIEIENGCLSEKNDSKRKLNGTVVSTSNGEVTHHLADSNSSSSVYSHSSASETHSKSGYKTILHGLSGKFESGKLVAVMGPSGAGKSSLMNILAGYRTSHVTGSILVNTVKRNLRSFRKKSCYIMQDDALSPHLTVSEAMNLAVNLKLASKTSTEEKDVIVQEILEGLGLTECLDTRTSCLSGGQRKRLAIGLEMVNNPPVMFLDEPTSGLDSTSCYQCICLLKQLASQGRTIICTIHQPSARIFEMFDTLYMLVDGQCAYNGPVSQLVPFLRKHNLNCPSFHNPADFVMEVASGEYGLNQLQEMIHYTRYADVETKAAAVASIEEETETEKAVEVDHSPRPHPQSVNNPKKDFHEKENVNNKSSPLHSPIETEDDEIFQSCDIRSQGSNTNDTSTTTTPSSSKDSATFQQYKPSSTEHLPQSVQTNEEGNIDDEHVPMYVDFSPSRVRNIARPPNLLAISLPSKNENDETLGGQNQHLNVHVGSDRSSVQSTEQSELSRNGNGNTETTRVHNTFPTSTWTQIRLIWIRSVKSILRDATLTKLRLISHVGIALLLGLLYYDIGNEASRVYNNAAMLFFCMLFCMFSAMMPTVMTFPLELATFRREHLNYWYSAKSYYIAKSFADLPFQLLYPILFVVIIYFLTSQPMEASRFFMFTTMCILTALISQSIGLVFGCACSAETAVFVGPVITMPIMLFSGFFVTLSDIPYYMHWLTYLNFVRFSFEGTIQSIYGFNRTKLECSVPYCHFKYATKFMEELAMEDGSFTLNVVVLIFIFVALRVAGYFVLKYKLYCEK